MHKNEDGKWVNGSAAIAKYHLQVRCNSKMMEMTSYYLNLLCGDGTPPRETVMTARAKPNEKTGEMDSPKKTTVKKYSFTYAMAFERFSQGKGLVSCNDRQTLLLLDELIGLVHKILPMATDEDTKEPIMNWQNNLRKTYDFIDNGQKPIYLTDLLGCWPEQLQLAMRIIYENKPNDKWRIDMGEIVNVLKKYGIVEKDAIIISGKDNNKDNSRDYWRKEVNMELDTRYNIRMSSRFPAENYNSEKVRGWLEWIYNVPSCTEAEDRRTITSDIEILREFIKDARRYPKTISAKKKIGTELRNIIQKLSTNHEDFWQKIKQKPSIL